MSISMSQNNFKLDAFGASLAHQFVRQNSLNQHISDLFKFLNLEAADP